MSCFPDADEGSFDSLDSDTGVNEAGQRNSQTQSAMQSKADRVGNRYYEVAEGYDKRVYENDCNNYGRIILTLIGFWIFNGLHWWAIFEFGMWNSDAFMIYSIAIFCWPVIFIGFMLCSGKTSNKVLRELAFLKETIEEEKSKAEEAEKAKKIEAEYNAKVGASKSQAKLIDTQQ